MIRAVNILVDGQEGIFKTEKRVYIPFEYHTEEDFKGILQAVKKEFKRALKSGGYSGKPMLTVTLTGIHFNSADVKRYTIEMSPYELQYRNFNGSAYDITNTEECKTEEELVNKLMTDVEKTINNCMADNNAQWKQEERKAL